MVTDWLSDLGFHGPFLGQSNEVSGINRDFLAALDRRWWDPVPLPERCFSGSAALRAQAMVGPLLDRLVEVGGDVLVQDAALARLGPLWLGELEVRFEPVVVVRVLSRADAAFQAFAEGLQGSGAIASPATPSRAHTDLLWLHCHLELERWSRNERRLVAVCDEFAESGGRAGHRLRLALEDRLGRTLPALDTPTLPTLPEWAEPPPSERGRVLERIYRALCGQAKSEDARDCLDIAWAQLQVRVPASHQAYDASDDADLFHEARLQRLLGSCEYSPQFPKTRTVRRIADRILRRAGRGRKPTPVDPPFLFVSGNPAARSHLYRVRNPIEGLRRLGVPACWMSAKALERFDLKSINARCVILHRCAEDEALDALIDRCRRLGVPIGYDIDDLIFDAELIRDGGIHFIANLPEPERDAWLDSARGHERLMAAADFCLTPTQALAEQARRVNRQVRVIENGFCPEVLALSDLWRSSRHRILNGGGQRLGYASGTATHEADFATIARPLAEALKRHPDLGFTLVGSLNLTPHGALLPDSRVERRPLVEHVNLAHELARFDVNLIPLQCSPFCDAKSPLKYFEVALVGVPSVAVANPTYKELIRHGENGLLAHSEEEWTAHITMLANDADLRARLGALAREECVARFHADRLAEKYLQLP